MKLSQLKPNFSLMNPVEQLKFISDYRKKRHYDLIETTVIKVKTKARKKSGGKKISVTTEAFDLLKKLGLV